MKDFHFTTEKEQAEIEQILLQRKKKKSKQQLLFLSIFIFIVAIVVLYCIRMVLFTEFNGYVVVHNVRFRASEDIFVHDIYKHNGDLVKPGDTIYSYVSMDWFHEIGNINSESAVLVKARDLKLQYGLAYQNLAVLRAKLQEIKRQIELEDHNIRFGLSDNVHKLNLEREYKETEEQLKAEQRKLYVLQKAINESKDAVDRLGQVNTGGFSIQHVRDKKKMKELGVSTWAVIHSREGGFGLDENNNYIAKESLVLPEGYIKGSVGAGDAFCAGVLCGAEKGIKLETAIELGIGSAAASLSEASATDGMRTEAEAMKLYNDLR